MKKYFQKYSLVGVDGNAWSLISYTTRAMDEAYAVALERKDSHNQLNFGQEAKKDLVETVTSGTYDNLVAILSSKIAEINNYLSKEK